jgi:selenide,water dikinase
VPFDVLSLDIGSTPQLPDLLDASLGTSNIPAKPIRCLLEGWQTLLDRVASAPAQSLTIAIVGGGVGGVELLMAVQHRLQRELLRLGQPASNLSLHLCHRDAALLSGHNPWVQHRVCQILRDRGVQVHLREIVARTHAMPAGKLALICASGLEIVCDVAIWVTQAVAPPWLRASGLEVDARGFVYVDKTLRSLSHPQVFASGDVAALRDHPLPKAGVFAVRQGKILFENFHRLMRGQPLRAYQPQRHYLNLIGTSDGSAIASRGWLGWESPLLWRWKDAIDQGFISQFPSRNVDL